MSDLYTYLERDERTRLRESMELVQGNDGDSEAYWNAVKSAYRILGKCPPQARETAMFYREILGSILSRPEFAKVDALPEITRGNTLVQRIVSSLFSRRK